jgi:hypothetical protein
MTRIEAQREWLARFVFSMTGIRPKLDGLGDRDVALLFQAVTASEDRAKLTSSAQASGHSNHEGIPVRKLGAK